VRALEASDGDLQLRHGRVHGPQLFIDLRESSIHLREPLIHLREPLIHLREPLIHLREPLIGTLLDAVQHPLRPAKDRRRYRHHEADRSGDERKGLHVGSSRVR
jgi:hypothetical protein